MIRLLAPGALVAATVAAALITLLHFLSVRRPPVLLLPTARFLSPRDVRAVSRNRKPSDLLLLLLRVLALLAVGLAMSSPNLDSVSSSFANVIVADASWRSDSARLRELAGIDAESDVEVVFTDPSRGMRGELGSAWPAAWRAAAALLADESGIDSVGMHVFAPTAGVESYSGWRAWRLSWPGRVVVHTGAGKAMPDQMPDAMPSAIQVTGGPPDDAVRAGFDMYGHTTVGSSGMSAGARADGLGSATSYRVLVDRTDRRSTVNAVDASDIRSTDSSVDTSAAQAEGGASTVLINWPQNGVPAGWTPVSESAGALVVAGRAIIAPWHRSARAPDSMTPGRNRDGGNAVEGTSDAPGTPDAPIAINTPDARSGERVIAQWNDGTPAAIERSVNQSGGCIRDVGLLAPQIGDVMISQAARALFATLSAPCGAGLEPIPAAISADSGGLANSAPVRDLKDVITRKQNLSPSWLPAALLALALTLLGVEQLLRRQGDMPAGADR